MISAEMMSSRSRSRARPARARGCEVLVLREVRVASAGLVGALSVHTWCEDKVPMARVSDDGLKPAAAFVV